LLQGLPRLRSLETLSIFCYKLPEEAWPLSASLRVLDLGFGRGVKPDNSLPGTLFVRGRIRIRRGERVTLFPRAGCSASGSCELCVLRAFLSPEVRALPESFSRLTNLEELKLRADGLQSLFPGIGSCKELRQLSVPNHHYLHLPHL